MSTLARPLALRHTKRCSRRKRKGIGQPTGARCFKPNKGGSSISRSPTSPGNPNAPISRASLVRCSVQSGNTCAAHCISRRCLCRTQSAGESGLAFNPLQASKPNPFGHLSLGVGHLRGATDGVVGLAVRRAGTQAAVGVERECLAVRVLLDIRNGPGHRPSWHGVAGAVVGQELNRLGC